MDKSMGSNEVVRLELPARIVTLIDRMIEIGLWGDDREKVAMNLIREGVVYALWPMLRDPQDSEP